MPHNELVNVALSLHGSILLAAILAYYKFGERTELMEKGLRGWDSVLGELRRRIWTDLVDVIDSHMNSNLTVPTITAEHDPAYIETAINPVRSEAFRETIREFIERNSLAIADYRTLVQARIQWLGSARLLSWAILILMIAEIAIVGVLGLVDKLIGNPLPDWLIKWSWLPVAVLVTCVLLPLPIMQFKHDVMTRFKIKYDLF